MENISSNSASLIFITVFVNFKRVLDSTWHLRHGEKQLLGGGMLMMSTQRSVSEEHSFKSGGVI